MYTEIDKLTPLLIFSTLSAGLLYTATCDKNLFANRKSAWLNANFCLFHFQSESTQHHWSESIEQEHHPSLRQVRIRDRGYDLEY